ncbi:hypothetical protein G9A89_021331 [Geosiphon pyriformis]|nr:hypothetical protein G9A89_021331 [Geosiphon pyriformis]
MARADSGYISQHDSIYSHRSSQGLRQTYQILSGQEEAKNHISVHTSYSDRSETEDYNSYPTSPSYPPPLPYLQPSNEFQLSNTSRQGSSTQNGNSPLTSPGLQPYSIHQQPSYFSNPPSPFLAPSTNALNQNSTTPVNSPRITPSHSPTLSNSIVSYSRNGSLDFVTTPDSFYENNLIISSRSSSLPSSNRSSISLSSSKTDKKVNHSQPKSNSEFTETHSIYHTSTGIEDVPTAFNVTAGYDIIDEVFDAYHDESNSLSPDLPLFNIYNFRNSHQELKQIQESLEQEAKFQQQTPADFNNYYRDNSSRPKYPQQELESNFSPTSHPQDYAPQNELYIQDVNDFYWQEDYQLQSRGSESGISTSSESSENPQSTQSIASRSVRLHQYNLIQTQTAPSESQLSPSVDQQSDADASRNRKREAAVKEIITTERTYVDGLRKVVNVFLIPLRENYHKATSKNVILSTKPMASLEDITALFGNIEQLLSLHEQLLKQLEERYSNWSPNELISDIFLQIAPYLKMYTTYLKSFPQALATMERLNKESQSFKKFLTNCSEKPMLNGLALNSFLILPAQRIPRYKLLLEALFKYTHESHPDYSDLKKCVQQISVIAEDVNEKIRDAENQQKVIEIQFQVEDLPHAIVKPARRFIYKGDLFKVTHRTPGSYRIPGSYQYQSSLDVRTHFLFNDILLFCSDLQGKYKYKGQVDLAFATYKDIEDGQADQPYCFQIITKDQNDVPRSHFVRAKSQEEKIEWKTRIEDAISALANGIRMSYNNVVVQHLKPIRQSTFSVSSSTRPAQPRRIITADPLFHSPNIHSLPKTSKSKKEKEKQKSNRSSTSTVSSTEDSVKRPQSNRQSSRKKEKEKLTTFDMLLTGGLDASFA